MLLSIFFTDDAFLLVRNRRETEHMKEAFNSVYPHVKFDIEHRTNTLKLLDIELHINSEGEQRFYKKSERKGVFVNFKSALPSRSKLHHIRKVWEIKKRWSDHKDSGRHLSHFNSVLRLNGYPESLIRKSNRSSNNVSQIKSSMEEFVFAF